MKRFKDRPIKSKLTTFIVIATLSAVTALSSVFLTQRYSEYKAQIADEFSTITKIISDRSNAAILFEDKAALNETLSSLSLHSAVLVACTYNLRGELLAQFNPEKSSQKCPAEPQYVPVSFSEHSIDISEPILVNDIPAGSVYLSSSSDKIKKEFETAVYNVLALSSFIIFIALLFARYIQRFISDPLLDLKEAASQVSLENSDYSALVKKNDDEVGELVDAFNQMRKTIADQNAVILENTESLEQKVDQRTRDLAMANKELEAFSYSVSHDLKAPLRIIDGFSQALEEDFGQDMDPTARDYLTRIRVGSLKMSQLINSLLLLSRVTRHEITKQVIDLTSLAEKASEEVRMEDSTKTLNLNIHQNMTAVGDSDLIQIVLDNLIGNAWKYSQKKSAVDIEVGTSTQKNQTIYFVKDKGAGFDMKYADKILKPFSRLHPPEEFEGSGIGLATVNRIIERHHGKIWVESEVNEGSTFYFTLFPKSSNTDTIEQSNIMNNF